LLWCANDLCRCNTDSRENRGIKKPYGCIENVSVKKLECILLQMYRYWLVHGSRLIGSFMGFIRTPYVPQHVSNVVVELTGDSKICFREPAVSFMFFPCPFDQVGNCTLQVFDSIFTCQ